MLRSLRLACTVLLSVCLIYSPVLALPWFRPMPAKAATKTGLAPVPVLTPSHRSGELLVKYRGESTAAQRQQVRENFSVAQQLLPSGVEVFSLSDEMTAVQAVAELSKLDRVVEWVEPNYLIQVSSWKKTTQGKSLRGSTRTALPRGAMAPLVAVIDTGIAMAHPRLRSHLARRGGWNFLTDTAVVSDDNGHGTQMAGIITDVHPHARLLPLKALDAEGIGAISAVIAAMDRAVAEHAQVILYSFGTDGKSQALLEAIQRADRAGVVVVTAAGNEGHDLARAPQYPAAFQAPNLLTVAASNTQQALADFSNYGTLAQVAAPGVDVTTTTRPDSFTQISGTSAAAAYVAGVASQLKAVRPWVSATTINQSILQGARRLPALEGKVSAGLVDGKAARFALFHPTQTAQDVPKKDKAPVNKRLEERKKNFQARQALKEKPDLELPPSAAYQLDTTRNSRPARPEERVKINARQGAGYDDPVPTDTANFPAYFTEMVKATNDTGIAGSKALQQIDPTAGNSVIGGYSINLLSRNINFSAPVLSLAGRGGLNLTLGLSYNSNVWTKNPGTNTMFYNADRGFPAPGWRLGFGAIQGINNGGNIGPYNNTFLYIQPDGTRRALYEYGFGFGKYLSRDSSYLQFDANTKILRDRSGMQITFGVSATASGDFQFLPTQIKDRNGNFITIVYKQLSNNDTVLDYVLDTLGRRIDFYYQNNRLTEIRQDRNGTIFKYAIIDYTAVTLSGTFYNTSTYSYLNQDVSGTTVYVPSRITYPTGVNLRLVYNNYGQVNSVEKWVPTISGQGTARRIAYSSLTLATGVDSCPYLTSRSEVETDQGYPFTSRQFQYTYTLAYPNGCVQGCSQARVVEPGLGGPNTGTTYTILNVPYYGMSETQTISIAGAAYDTYGNASSGTLKTLTNTYIGDGGTGINPRLETSIITDQANHTRKIVLSYLLGYGSYFGGFDGYLLQQKDEYNSDGQTVYRRTTMTYQNYLSQGIIGLPLTTNVYAGPGTTLLAKTENVYDETTTYQDSNQQTVNYFLNAGATVQHDDTNYGSGFTNRGNLTTVKQYATNGTTNRILKRVSYDTNGNVRSTADAAGNRQTIDPTDNFTNKPAGLGATNAYVTLAADPSGMKAGTQYEYYTGLVVKTFAQRPNQSTEEQVTTMTYDFADRPLRTTAPTGSYVEVGYWDNLLRQTTYTKRDVINGVDQLVYGWQDFNGSGKVIRKGSDHPNGVAGKYSGQMFKYDFVGRGSEQSNVLAVTSTFAVDTTEPGQTSGWKWTAAEFDGMNRAVTLRQPDNTYLFNDFNVCGCAGGLVLDRYDESNNLKTTQTDFLGRLQYARELVPQISYDYQGDPYITGYFVHAEVEYVYDALDRLTQIIHRGNGSILPDAQTHLTGPGQTRSFVYDTWGRTQTETTPEAGTASYTYTANDQIATTTNANNKITTVAYNTRNLVTGISYNDSTPSVSYGYDDYGARTTMTDGEGAMSFTYNANRQLTSETRTFTGLGSNQYTYNYSYNLSGQLQQVNYVAPSFNKTVNYAYNPTGALQSLGTNLIGSDATATTNVISGMSYRAFGAASSVSYGNNRRATLTYDSERMRLWQMEVARPDGTDTIMKHTYLYQANGLISLITNEVDYAYNASYQYNYRNQLTQFYRYTSNITQTYNQDDWGNLTAAGATTFAYANQSGTQVPATNRLSSVTTNGVTTNFSYDTAGNMTAAGSTTYEWDAANRLKSVNSGALGSYGYDGNGKRVKKTESGTTTYYVISSVLGSALEVTSAGVQRAFVMRGEGAVAQLNPNGQFYWLHLDHLGSGRKMTDSTGALTYRAEFDPYGKLLYEWSSPADLNTKKFTGYERDAATNLDYAQARMYSSDWGRFMSPDPMGVGAARLTSPKSLNRYAYVENSPVSFVDPKGLFLGRPDGPDGVLCRVFGFFCVTPYDDLLEPQPDLGPEPVPDLEPLDNRFPGFNPNELKQLLDAKEKAQELLSKGDCQQGLADAKIDLNKLISAIDSLIPRPDYDMQYYKYNIFNAPLSTDGQVQKDVSLNGTTAGAFVYANLNVPVTPDLRHNIWILKPFWNVSGSKKIGSEITKAIALIHESVHLTGKLDADFAGGSSGLSTIIVKACWSKLYTANDLAFVT